MANPILEKHGKNLQAENELLKARLAEAEETLRAISHGEVDALVVDSTSGPQIFTLRGAEKPHRLLLEAMNEGAMTLMPDGIVFYGNTRLSEMVNKPLEQIIGSPWQKLFPVDEHPAFLSSITQIHQVKEGRSNGESALQRADGTWLPVHVSLSSLDLNGVQAVAVLLTDISKRKAAEEALAQANEELRDMVQELEHFSYTITHDMRAPLRAMHGISRMLIEDCDQCEQAERRDYLRRIADAATRMDNLITDALNYNRAMREHLELEPVDAKALLYGMLETYPEFQPHRADIRVEGEIPTLLGNKAGLTQCFSNLLSNAIKFVDAHKVPQVRVWSETRGEWVRLNFEDNGIGIPAQYQEQVWEMFQTLSKKYKGTGIGLALVRRVMRRMGGNVGLTSEPGKGSCFWLELKSAA